MVYLKSLQGSYWWMCIILELSSSSWCDLLQLLNTIMQLRRLPGCSMTIGGCVMIC